jgi:hypothetical protein
MVGKKEDFLSELMKLGARIPPPKHDDDIGTKKFLHFFKDIYTEDDIYRGVHTHLCMTGGKWAFPAIEAVEPTIEPEGPVDVNDKGKSTTGITDCWFKPNPNHTHKQTSCLEQAYLFYKRAPAIIGRNATYEELFWVAFETWTKRMKSYARPENQSDYNVCITECRSYPLFRMYVDLDFVEPARVDNAEWKLFVGKVCKVIAGAVVACYASISKDSTTFYMTVLQTKDFTDKASGVKRGIHLIWPNLIVDERTAHRLVASMEIALTSKGPRRDRTKGQNLYEDAIDTSVYRSGLRLPGCPKCELCPTCGKNRQVFRARGLKTCQDEYISHADKMTLFCPDHRKFPMGYGFRSSTAYTITDICAGNGQSIPEGPFMKLMNAHVFRDKSHNRRVFSFHNKALASIRTTETETTLGYKVSLEIEHLLSTNLKDDDVRIQSKWDVEAEKENKMPKGSKQKLLGKRLTASADEVCKSYRRDHEIVVPSKVMNAMQVIIRRFDEHYRQIIILRPMAYASNKQETLPDGRKVLHSKVRFSTTGEGSTFCLMKGASHTSNTITFWVSCDGVCVTGCWSGNMHNGRICSKSNSKCVNRVMHIEGKDLDVLHTILNTPITSFGEGL